MTKVQMLNYRKHYFPSVLVCMCAWFKNTEVIKMKNCDEFFGACYSTLYHPKSDWQAALEIELLLTVQKLVVMYDGFKQFPAF